MSDGSVRRNESPENIKSLFLFNNRVSSSLRMHHWILNQNIARQHFYSQAIYEFMFIPSDTKMVKTGVDLTIMDKKQNNVLG